MRRAQPATPANITKHNLRRFLLEIEMPAQNELTIPVNEETKPALEWMWSQVHAKYTGRTTKPVTRERGRAASGGAP